MSVTIDDTSVKDDEKIVTFVAFCIECYKAIHGISGHEVADLFRKYGVEPVNVNAKNCPYSYWEAGIDLEAWAKAWAEEHGLKFDNENIWKSDGKVHEDVEEQEKKNVS